MRAQEARSRAIGIGEVPSIDDFFEDAVMPAGMAMQRARKQLADYKYGRFFRTGIRPLDERLRLVDGDLILVGGRAASGKTALGLQIIRNVLKQQDKMEDKRPVIIFSAEMTAASLMMREAAAAVDIPITALVTRTATEEEYAKVDDFLLGIGAKNYYLDHLFIDQSPAPTLEHMASQLEQLPDLALCVFDYTDLAGEMAHSQLERITKITRGLKALAKKYNIPVLALAQLNRDVEKRENKKVQMSDFMFGGEQAADIALGLMRPWTYDNTLPKELVECHICKYRNGPTGVVDMSFNERTMSFSGAVRIQVPLNG